MKNKKNYITVLSVISAFAVVFLHTNGCFWIFNKQRYWITANIIECVFYFAVPVFFMITGANLIDYHEKYTTKEYFKKRMKKVLIPYIVWSLFGIVYMQLKNNLSILDIDIKYIFNALLNGTAIDIYWFFPPLLCVYLCLPMLTYIEKEKKKKVFSYLVLAGFILNLVVPFIFNVFNLGIWSSITVVACNNYLLYVLIGYLLDNSELKKGHRILIYILGILGLLAHIIGTQVLSYSANSVVQTYKGYLNVPCILYSISIFVFVKEICKNAKENRLINIISKYTFAIYLIHWYILDFSSNLLKIDIRSIFYRLGAPFVIVAICILITFLIRKIPIIKKILP